MGRPGVAAALGGASVNRFLPLLLMTACAANRLTHARNNLRSCWAADPNLIACAGKRMASIECFAPGDEACGALESAEIRLRDPLGETERARQGHRLLQRQLAGVHVA